MIKKNSKNNSAKRYKSGGFSDFLREEQLAFYYPEPIKESKNSIRVLSLFSGCGTFVPMRGGNDLQAIVRKHEPQGLRIFLQDGFTDTWNPIFGSWYEANRRLASALEFAGYDCKFDWAPGGHSVVRTSEIFPDVMVWMWRDHPAKIKANPTGNGLLKELLIEGEDWIAEKTVAEIPDSKVVEAIYPGGSLVAVTVPGSTFIDQ